MQVMLIKQSLLVFIFEIFPRPLLSWMHSCTLADILHFCYLPANHTHSQSYTHAHSQAHTQSSAIKTNKYKAIAALVCECVCSHECECKEETHTQTHKLTHSHTHASIAAACESKEQKKERARIGWMLLATSRRAVASFRMWLCLWTDDASDERPLVAADTGDEQQQVGGAGAVLCHRS